LALVVTRAARNHVFQPIVIRDRPPEFPANRGQDRSAILRELAVVVADGHEFIVADEPHPAAHFLDCTVRGDSAMVDSFVPSDHHVSLGLVQRIFVRAQPAFIPTLFSRFRF